MPKLNTFDIVIRTGKNGTATKPKWVINGFPVDFEQMAGGTAPGETFEATGNPGSYPHTLLLHGPDEGLWDLDEVQITYYPQGEEPYSVRLGAVTLDESSDLNIWQDRPQPVFDV